MKYLNALNLIPGIGSQTLRTLMSFFPSAETVWNATYQDLSKTNLSTNQIEKILNGRNDIDPEQEWEKLLQQNIHVLSLNDENYPSLLREIPHAPFLLYARGNLECLSYPCIAIVGSRKYSDYGKRSVEKFSSKLAKSGLCVVSGLALGIDALAHRACLDANGKTIAILGSSIDNANIYPRNNYELAQEIIANGGLLLSEFPVPTKPNLGTFPARNRLIAGLSLGTLIIEAGQESGSLITANFAVEFNREVFAVPGSIFSSQSEGTNTLIKKGAKLTSSINDILEEFNINHTQENVVISPNIELSEQEKIILDVLSPEPIHIDRISRVTKLETSTIGSNLAILEIKGVIKNIGGQNYIKL